MYNYRCLNMKVTDLLAKEIKKFSVKSGDMEIKDDERSIIHYISTNDKDRGGDIVDPEGMDDKDFAKSPSVWYNHNYRYDNNAIPIAKSLWRKKESNGVLTKTNFATTLFADDIYELHKGNFIESWSIGWQPRFDAQGNVVKGAVEYNEKTNVTYINLWDLLEYSSAPIAMNPNALDQIKAISGLNFKSDMTSKMLDELKFQIQITEVVEAISRDFKDLNELVNELKNENQVLAGDIKDLTEMIEADKEEAKKKIKDEVKKNSPTVITVDNARLQKISNDVIDGVISKHFNS